MFTKLAILHYFYLLKTKASVDAGDALRDISSAKALEKFAEKEEYMQQYSSRMMSHGQQHGQQQQDACPGGEGE